MVLDDLPERALPPDGGERLRAAVEAGLGLAVLGGPDTLGPGGFGGRPVEDALPVRCAPDRPRPLVVLAVDGSGSMESSAAGGPSLAAAARDAAADLARRLPSDVLLSLVFFRDAPGEATAPFDLSDPAARKAAVEEASRVRAPGGGTRFGAAAEGALGAAARAAGPGARRLLLVTDGRPAEEPAELERIARSLVAARFSVKVVAVGDDPDLQRLAALTGGPKAGGVVRAGTADLAAVLGGLAGEEGRAPWEPGTAAVRAGPDLPPFGPVPSGLPAVAGFDRVFPRKEGRVWLALEDGAPLLAGRQAGLERSVVFAAAPGAGSGEWSAGPAAAVLEAALRWTFRAPGTEGAQGTTILESDGSVEARLETLSASAPAARGPAPGRGGCRREREGRRGSSTSSPGARCSRAPSRPLLPRRRISSSAPTPPHSRPWSRRGARRGGRGGERGPGPWPRPSRPSSSCSPPGRRRRGLPGELRPSSHRGHYNLSPHRRRGSMANRSSAASAALLVLLFLPGCVTEGEAGGNIDDQVHQKIEDFATLRGSSYEENVRVLGGLLRTRAVPKMVEAVVKHSDPRVRAGCALALSDSQDPAAVGPLFEVATGDSVPGVRYTAAYCLCRFRDPRGLPVLFEALRSSEGSDRYVGIYRLREVTGMDFGFKENDPPEKRVESIQRWEAWFKEAGTQGAAMKLMPPESQGQ